MTAEEFNHCLYLISIKDELAAKEFYNTYYDKIVYSAQRELKDQSAAKDVASNVLLSIIKNAKNYKNIENPDAWMYNVIKFAIINYKKQNAKYVYTQHIDEAHYSKSENLYFKMEVKRAVEKLSKRQQKIFQLHYLYDYDINNAAKELKISRSTVNREIEVIKQKLEYLNKF